jgi:hypothetical protein
VGVAGIGRAEQCPATACTLSADMYMYMYALLWLHRGIGGVSGNAQSLTTYIQRREDEIRRG